MAQLPDLQQRFINMMRQTGETLGHILKNITQEQATTLRDGPEGWTILEIVCHLRDFDIIFRQRAERILAEDEPELLLVDHEQLVIDNNYAAEELAYVHGAYDESRQATIAFFEGLQEADWARIGIHPSRGRFSLTDAALQVGSHDVNHLEQITRILEQEEPGSGALPSEQHDSEG